MLATAVGDEGDVGPGASCFHSRDLRLFMATALKGPGSHRLRAARARAGAADAPEREGPAPPATWGPGGLAQPGPSGSQSGPSPGWGGVGSDQSEIGKGAGLPF